jgi:hypothetical protein
MEYEIFKSGPRKGQPKTLTDRVIRFIEEGLKRKKVFDSRSKSLQFDGLVPGSIWFIGKAGSVRTGKTKSNSFSITDKIHKMMKVWEEQNGL